MKLDLHNFFTNFLNEQEFSSQFGDVPLKTFRSWADACKSKHKHCKFVRRGDDVIAKHHHKEVGYWNDRHNTGQVSEQVRSGPSAKEERENDREEKQEWDKEVDKMLKKLNTTKSKYPKQFRNAQLQYYTKADLRKMNGNAFRDIENVIEQIKKGGYKTFKDK